MILVGKTVYTVNAETNKVDRWKCVRFFIGTYHNRKERLYVLEKGKKKLYPPGALCICD